MTLKYCQITLNKNRKKYNTNCHNHDHNNKRIHKIQYVTIRPNWRISIGVRFRFVSGLELRFGVN